MRYSPETILIGAISAFAITGMVAVTLSSERGDPVDFGGQFPIEVVEPVAVTSDAAAWFGYVRQFCNPVDVESRLRLEPAPATPEGAMHEAACYALAGRIDRARERITSLEPDMRYVAAGVVFAAGHPAADAGDDVAAGPLMELVVEFWPNHYMALYHAGAARYDLGDYVAAKSYLDRFMVEYSTEDGWRSSSREMLARIAEAG